MTFQLSVITPTRNRAPLLARCLACLASQSLPPSQYEIIVIDDASTDDTRAVVEEAQRTAPCDIRAFWLSQRMGISGTRNLAIREARGEVIVFVDSDSFAPPTYLAAHLAAHSEHPDHVICRGPVILTRSLDRPFETRQGLLDISTAFFDTDNASVRREDLSRAGLFDEGLAPYGWEGLDMGLRLRELGLRRVFQRSAPLYHYQPEVSPGSLEVMLAKEDERARTAWLFYAKHPTFESRLALQLTAFHRGFNLMQRAFGAIHAGNVEAWVARACRWGLPGLGRILLAGVLNEQYLSRLTREKRAPERARGD
jgi:glycosyltransferase involved in cell wall biosynthesis